jgi:hypothetical protein
VYFVQFWVFMGPAAYRDKRKLSVSLCVFRAPLSPDAEPETGR